jgi:hypothetical protein
MVASLETVRTTTATLDARINHSRNAHRPCVRLLSSQLVARLVQALASSSRSMALT